MDINILESQLLHRDSKNFWKLLKKINNSEINNKNKQQNYKEKIFQVIEEELLERDFKKI
jgi:hypothetical protein